MKRKKEDLTKKQVNHYLSKIYKLLSQGPCQVRWKRILTMNGCLYWGICDYGGAENGDDILWLAAEEKSDIVRFGIHECLHSLRDDLPESQIIWLTKQIHKNMSAAQYAHFIMALAENLKQHYRFRVI